MNKTLNIFNVTLFILFSCLFLFILFYLFFHIFYFESFFYYSIHQDNYFNVVSDCFRISEDLSSTSLNNADNRSNSERSSLSYSSSFSSQDVHCFNSLDKYKEASSRIFNKIKNNINNKTKYASHKIKIFDRTLSWFFKGSKPGGGRGL